MSNKSINNSWNRNEDGSGYAFIKDGVIQTKKYLELKDFKKSYNQDFKKYGHNSKFLIHFRYATHGVNDLSNVHPFKVNSSMVFGHNGVINTVRDDKKLSDTRVFNVDILQKLNSNFFYCDTTLELISEYIGGSKLVFLNSKNEFKIVNEADGHWNKKGSIWYSNDSYKKPKYYYNNIGGGYRRSGMVALPNDCGTDACNTDDKKQSFNLADDSFLVCDWCQTKTDRTTTIDGDFKICDACNREEQRYGI